MGLRTIMVGALDAVVAVLGLSFQVFAFGC